MGTDIEDAIEQENAYDDFIESWSNEHTKEGQWGGCPWLSLYAPLQFVSNSPYLNLQNITIASLHFRRISIKENAYFRWETAGYPEDRDLEFWLEAETAYDANDDDNDDWVVVNRWYSRSNQAVITIFKEKTTEKRKVTVDSQGNWESRLNFFIATYETANVWSLKAELKATEKLQSKITPKQFRYYTLLGCFLEQSKLSNLYYMFRKCRPTLVFSSCSYGWRPITALCSHTTGYYEGTWAGALTPTDEVVAHLLRMRHDEHNFWKRSNQHPLYAIQAGI